MPSKQPGAHAASGPTGAPPSPHEARERLARAGDFGGLLEEILSAPRGTVDLRGAFAQLRAATKVASRGDPAAFTDALFREALGLSAYVLLRLHFACSRALDGADAAASPDRPHRPPEFTRELLPQLSQMHAQAAEMAHAWAATARLWGLAARHKRGADGAEKAGTSTAGAGAKARGRRWRPGRGDLGDLLDGSPN